MTIPVAFSSGTPLYNISSIPRNLQATAGPQSVSLTWNKKGSFEKNLKHYALERTSDNFVTVATFTVSGTSTSYVDEGLTNSISYSYRVRAVLDLPGQGAGSGQAV